MISGRRGVRNQKHSRYKVKQIKLHHPNTTPGTTPRTRPGEVWAEPGVDGALECRGAGSIPRP